MSSYWAAYHGQGLVLTQNEFNRFLENYRSKTVCEKSLSMIRDFEDWEVDLEEIDFRSPSGELFNLFCVPDDHADGFYFVPYRIQGKPNERWENNKNIPRNNVYVLGSDKEIAGMHCFEEKAYDSYESFVDEFKRKMAHYLPDDFDWDAHVGIYSYACLA